MFAGADEEDHMRRATAAIRLHFDRPYDTPYVPYADYGSCWRYDKTAVPECLEDILQWDKASNTDSSRFDGTPPFAHIFMGVPTLFLTERVMLYAIRLATVLWSSTAIALGICLMIRNFRSPRLIGPLLLSLPPYGYFVASTAGTSAFTYSTFFLIAACLTVLSGAEVSQENVCLLDVVLVSVALLLMTRKDSILWLAVVLVPIILFHAKTLVGYVRWRHLLLEFPLIAASWTIFAVNGGSRSISGFSSPSLGYTKGTLRGVLDIVPAFREVFSLEGRLTDSPLIIGSCFLLLAGLVVFENLKGTNAIESLPVVLTLLFAILSIVAIGWLKHPYMQARYLLPIIPFVLLPLGATKPTSTMKARSLSVIIGGAYALLMTLQIFFNTRRNAVGVDGPILFVSADWNPPLVPSFLTTIMLCVATIGFVLSFVVFAISGNVSSGMRPDKIRCTRSELFGDRKKVFVIKRTQDGTQ